MVDASVLNLFDSYQERLMLPITHYAGGGVGKKTAGTQKDETVLCRGHQIQLGCTCIKELCTETRHIKYSSVHGDAIPDLHVFTQLSYIAWLTHE